MSDYAEQIDRIREKFERIKQADPNLRVFGAERHRYHFNKPATNYEVHRFEKTYGITLPESYRAFITTIANGGLGYMESAPGPFYGIFPLGVGVKELLYSEPEKHLGKPCVLSPDMDEAAWKSLAHAIEDDEDDTPFEEYEEAVNRVFAGVLPIGSQGCSYLHGIVLNGPHTGKVVNLDMDGQQPQFTHEAHFLDWYERWLDEIIDGTLLQDDPSWFGYGVGGNAVDLFDKWAASEELETWQYLRAILRKAEVSSEVLTKVEAAYRSDPEETILLQILLKFDYKLGEPHLRALSEQDFHKTIEILHAYGLAYAADWVDYIKAHIEEIKTNNQYFPVRKVLEASGQNFGQIILPLLESEALNVRLSVINTLGNLPQKHDFLDVYKAALEDADLTMVNHALGALYECKDRSLLPYYQKILEGLSENPNEEEDRVLYTLNQNLKLFGMSMKQLRKYEEGKSGFGNRFKFWK